jgi:hypothetical protein
MTAGQNLAAAGEHQSAARQWPTTARSQRDCNRFGRGPAARAGCCDWAGVGRADGVL